MRHRFKWWSWRRAADVELALRWRWRPRIQGPHGVHGRHYRVRSDGHPWTHDPADDYRAKHRGAVGAS